MARVNSRLEALENATPPPSHDPFDPDVTVVIANLPLTGPDENESHIMNRINDMLSVGMELPGIEPVAVTRRASRGDGVGLVLLELADLDSKKEVLRAKTKLRGNPAYSNLYVRSAEGHTDRLIRLNFTTLLRHFELTRQYRITGSGRLLPRNAQDQRATGDARNSGNQDNQGNQGNQGGGR